MMPVSAIAGVIHDSCIVSAPHQCTARNDYRKNACYKDYGQTGRYNYTGITAGPRLKLKNLLRCSR